MASRTTDLQIRIGSTLDGRGFKSAEASARAMEREFAKLEAAQRAMAKVEADAYRESDRMAAAHAAVQKKAAEDQRSALRKVGTAAGLAGAAIALGLGVAAKAAMDWETAWAGVTKVVAGTPAQLDALQGQLRQLAKELPVSAEEIAGVAAAAGQLGVARQDIVEFTRTAIALGVSTNLSAEDAATALAKLGNIMGVLPSQVDRAGAALVALGNEGASTESDILDMAVRIAGAGRQAGITEAQVLGLANALTSVGLNAEEGGSAISRVLLDINAKALTGGAALSGYAKVAGQTVSQFGALVRTNPAAALQAFIGGLGTMQASGGNVVQVLTKLGLGEIRVRDTLLRAAGASDLITASLKLGTQAWQDNTALVNEASKRYETTASRLQIARNTLNDAAIDLGNNLAPALATTASGAAGAAEAFQSLPGPLKEGVSLLGVFSATSLLAFSGLSKGAEKVKDLGGALKALRSGGVGAGGLSAVSLATGGLATALGIGAVALGIWADKQAKARQEAEDLKNTLDQQTGAVTENTKAFFIKSLQDEQSHLHGLFYTMSAFDAAKRLGVSLADLTDAALGNADAAARVRAQTESVKGSFEDANVAAQDFSGSGYGITAKNRLNDYNQALLVVNGAIDGNNKKIGEAAGKVRDANEAMAGTATATKNLSGATDHYADANRDAVGTQDGLTRALAGSSAGAGDLEQSLTEAGKAAVKAGQDAAAAFARDTDVLANFDPTGAAASASKASDKVTAARKRLADVEDRLKGKAKTSATDTRALTAAQQALTKAQQAANAASGKGSLAKAYKDAISLGQNFIRDIRRATEQGLDPSAIAKLLEEGPAKAEPILQQMVKDHSGKLIAITNASEQALSQLTTFAAEQARLTTLATQSGTDQMTKDLGSAMALQAQLMTAGGAKSAAALEAALHLSPAGLRRLVGEYGITLPANIQAELSAHAPALKLDAHQFGAAVKAAQALLDGLKSKHVVVTFDAKGLAAVTQTAQTAYGSRFQGADGGILRFAEGGFAPLGRRGDTAHIAQVAPAGAMRLWAEPETGGEAYIPLASTKRSRSKKILEEVAKRFAGEVVWGKGDLPAVHKGRSGRTGHPTGKIGSATSWGPDWGWGQVGSGIDFTSNGPIHRTYMDRHRWPGQPPIAAQPRERVVIVQVPVHESHTRTAQFGDVHVSTPDADSFTRWARTAGTHT